ncbi:MAG TPA: type I-MYXAN CRISPR-associated protein Cas6/Cmx6 [Planctomycetota bacterium]|nr:type I-MYXAN CRISPR-associated protein Cas6/Cmx6 [Planctomycetota bacterium]
MVELSFRVIGAALPFDHGYLLYGALSGLIPELHGLERFSLGLVRGQPLGDGSMRLGAEARLQLRLGTEHVPMVLPLAGKTLRVGGDLVQIGTPEIRALAPNPVLQSRFVTIKKFDRDPESFGEAVRRQMDALDVRGGRVQVGARRAVRISGVRIVGFGVTIFDLADEDSLRVLESGIGGRRRMGCGVFEGLGKDAARAARENRPGRAVEVGGAMPATGT